jgi:hypothetical protein
MLTDAQDNMDEVSLAADIILFAFDFLINITSALKFHLT